MGNRSGECWGMRTVSLKFAARKCKQYPVSQKHSKTFSKIKYRKHCIHDSCTHGPLCRIIVLKKMSTVSQTSKNAPVPAQSTTVFLLLCSLLLQDFSIQY